MSDADLQDICTQWQARLRLQDWDVSVQFSRARDMPLDNSAGTCSWQERKRRAVIKVMAECDHPPGNEWPHSKWNPEYTIVHELLHLHFAPFAHAEDTPEDTAEEIAIHRIALALIEGYKPLW